MLPCLDQIKYQSFFYTYKGESVCVCITQAQTSRQPIYPSPSLARTTVYLYCTPLLYISKRTCSVDVGVRFFGVLSRPSTVQLNTMQTPQYRTRCMLHVHCICVHVYFVVVYISQSRLPYYRTRCSRYGVYICVMVQLVPFIAVVQCTMATSLYGLQVSHTPYIRWLGVSRTGHMQVQRA